MKWLTGSRARGNIPPEAGAEFLQGFKDWIQRPDQRWDRGFCVWLPTGWRRGRVGSREVAWTGEVRFGAGAEDGIRTRDPLLGKEMLYH